MKKFAKEFKKFVMRGNVIDLAVGIVVGGAFGKIVSSFVGDVLMPPIGVMLGGVDFSQINVTLRGAVIKNGETINNAVTLNYGTFIQTIVDFVIIAFAIFLVVKAMNKMQKKEEEKPKELPRQEKLLTEIRDLLKNK